MERKIRLSQVCRLWGDWCFPTLLQLPLVTTRNYSGSWSRFSLLCHSLLPLLAPKHACMSHLSLDYFFPLTLPLSFQKIKKEPKLFRWEIQSHLCYRNNRSSDKPRTVSLFVAHNTEPNPEKAQVLQCPGATPVPRCSRCPLICSRSKYSARLHRKEKHPEKADSCAFPCNCAELFGEQTPLPNCSSHTDPAWRLNSSPPGCYSVINAEINNDPP